MPTYAPVSLYASGYLMRLGDFGLFLIMLLPATAVAAFAAGAAHLLPPVSGAAVVANSLAQKRVSLGAVATLCFVSLTPAGVVSKQCDSLPVVKLESVY